MASATTRLRHLVPENTVRFLGHETHTHDVPHLIHVSQGTAHLSIDGDEVTLHRHETVWLAAGIPHAARYEPDSLVLGPMLSPESAPPVPVQRLGAVPSITAIMTTILGVAPRTEEQIAELRHALDAALRELGTAHFVVPVPTHPVVARVVRDAVRSSWTLADLAARHGTSARHVQRIVLQETGLPFGRWRARARLNPAIARLRAGEPFEHVARAVGYASRSGLAKALAREVDEATLVELRGGEPRAASRSERTERAIGRPLDASIK